MPEVQDQKRHRYKVGTLALSAVILIWVSSSFVMNNMFANLKYNKPFMITYINTATFSLYLLPYLFNLRNNNSKASTFAQHTATTETEIRLLGNEDLDNDAPDTMYEIENESSKLGTAETIRLALIFCLLWFMANYTTNASLAYTSVTSSTILSSMSGLCTLAIGALVGVEPFSLIKMLAVCTSFIGVIIVTYSDQSGSEDTPMSPSAHLIGDLLALSGAIFYGCYTTLLKLKIGDESRINMPLFFGFVGIFNLLLLWPFFFILNYFELEKFELPFSASIWIMIFLNAFVGTFMSDYLWLLAMLMTSPLVVTLGVSLTIPLAVAGDAVFTHVVPGLEYALGAILVIAGFFVVNMATLKNDRHFRQANDQQSNENEASTTQALHTSSRLASNDGPRGGLYK
ncbi:hypothetical protein RMATCC62417_17207 [Rhizopus microsporus]|nr:hypothetical protein RMATCC62417_17207 [Rhizopus microsporus]